MLRALRVPGRSRVNVTAIAMSSYSVVRHVIFLYKDAFAQLLRRCVNGTVISLSVLDVRKEKSHG